jgi:L-ascorbate metabolism protein UlaG (beta-lactamase superfamily)
MRASLAGAALSLLLTACAPYHAGAQSDHFDGEVFFNPTPSPLTFTDFWKWQFTREPARWPEQIENPPSEPPPARVEGPELHVTMVGHASVLLQTGGLNILTDPIWSKRATPFGPLYGPVRRREPGVAFDALPKIDVVVVSHNHYDHLDLPSLRMLWERDRPKIIVPLGNAEIVQRAGGEIETIEVDWGQSVEVGNGAHVIATPVQHWSQRGAFDRNKALWAGYILDAPGGGVFFAGDTGLGDGWWVTEVKKLAAPPRLALLPIGSFVPRWFMAYQHVNPEEAVKIQRELSAPYALGVHWGTFPMADDGPDDALIELDAARKSIGVSAESFRTLLPGESWRLK